MSFLDSAYSGHELYINLRALLSMEGDASSLWVLDQLQYTTLVALCIFDLVSRGMRGDFG